jgi:hypothetical protein
MSAVVIYMDSSRAARVQPKCESGMHMGHRYVLQFDPNASPDERWCWIVKFTRVYDYVGSAPTIEAAMRAAKRQIKELVQR